MPGPVLGAQELHAVLHAGDRVAGMLAIRKEPGVID